MNRSTTLTLLIVLALGGAIWVMIRSDETDSTDPQGAGEARISERRAKSSKGMAQQTNRKTLSQVRHTPGSATPVSNEADTRPAGHYVWNDPVTGLNYWIKDGHHPVRLNLSGGDLPDSTEIFWNVPDGAHIEYDSQGIPRQIDDGWTLGADGGLYESPEDGWKLELNPADHTAYHIEEGSAFGPDGKLYAEEEGWDLAFYPDTDEVYYIEKGHSWQVDPSGKVWKLEPPSPGTYWQWRGDEFWETNEGYYWDEAGDQVPIASAEPG
jgi:hypothetical protein